jgi:hypothetical protein
MNIPNHVFWRLCTTYGTMNAIGSRTSAIRHPIADWHAGRAIQQYPMKIRAPDPHARSNLSPHTLEVDCGEEPSTMIQDALV